MNIWILGQLVLNLIFLAGIVYLLIHRKQSHREDQKFSKGLQLLQTKISVLEDLSDQTDDQVRSLTKLLEDKYREIQSLLVESDRQIQKMEEIAQNTMSRLQSSEGNPLAADPAMNKYVKAAQMAHSGASMEEILKTVDLTRGEVELIVAMNKDQLVFNQHRLPLWVDPDKAAAPQESTIGAEFLKALKTPSAAPAPAGQANTRSQGAGFETASSNAQSSKPAFQAGALIPQNGKTLNVKPFEFRKID
ncbi:MAG: DUF2802 domain-containing protein [Bdellovibrionales bacterium]